VSSCCLPAAEYFSQLLLTTQQQQQPPPPGKSPDSLHVSWINNLPTKNNSSSKTTTKVLNEFYQNTHEGKKTKKTKPKNNLKKFPFKK
jgi:hypothetical protein